MKLQNETLIHNPAQHSVTLCSVSFILGVTIKVIMLNVIMLSVVMLSVFTPLFCSYEKDAKILLLLVQLLFIPQRTWALYSQHFIFFVTYELATLATVLYNRHRKFWLGTNTLAYWNHS